MDYKMEDKLWLVEWVKVLGEYRVCKYVEPDRVIAYEDSWQEAVSDIRGNYGIDSLIIFIKKPDGTVDYCVKRIMFRRCA